MTIFKQTAQSIFVVVVLSSVPWMVCAAGNSEPSFDQYPSFIQLNAMADTTQTVLRCGYQVQGGQVVADPAYQDISTLDEAKGTYMRVQHIDNAVIVIWPAVAGGSRLLLEIVWPNGAVMAKNCAATENDNVIQNCSPAQPLQPAQTIMDTDRQLNAQCAALLVQSAPKLNASLADPQKTLAFKAELRKRVAILSQP